ARLLDFSGRIHLDFAMVRNCAGCGRTGACCETRGANRGTPMSFLAFFLIVVSLLSFVVAQLILKRAMEFSAKAGLRHSRFILLVTLGVLLMTVSFFITLGLLQRFDLSYLYPFQGLSVVIITLIAALILKEKLSWQLMIGALLITAGVVLVSMS